MSVAREAADDLSDLLGPSSDDLSDLLGPAPAVKRKKRVKTGKKSGARKDYEHMEPPDDPQPGGIWALRQKKGKNLGRTCLICNEKLPQGGRGRPPIICPPPNNYACHRAYRNAYRLDYDKVTA